MANYAFIVTYRHHFDGQENNFCPRGPADNLASFWMLVMTACYQLYCLRTWNNASFMDRFLQSIPTVLKSYLLPHIRCAFSNCIAQLRNPNAHFVSQNTIFVPCDCLAYVTPNKPQRISDCRGQQTVYQTEQRVKLLIMQQQHVQRPSILHHRLDPCFFFNRWLRTMLTVRLHV